MPTLSRQESQRYFVVVASEENVPLVTKERGLCGVVGEASGGEGALGGAGVDCETFDAELLRPTPVGLACFELAELSA